MRENEFAYDPCGCVCRCNTCSRDLPEMMRDRIAELEATVAAQQDVIAQLSAPADHLSQTLAEAQIRIAQLEAICDKQRHTLNRFEAFVEAWDESNINAYECDLMGGECDCDWERIHDLRKQIGELR